MSPVLADVLLVIALIGTLALVHRPFGDYMAAVHSSRTVGVLFLYLLQRREAMPGSSPW